MNAKSWAELTKEPMRLVTEVKSVERTSEGTKILFLASTGIRDRDQETIDPLGWTWNEAKLPNQLYGHDSWSPENWIGKGVSIRKDSSGLFFECMLFDRSPSPVADLARQMAWLAENHLDAISCSVGFLPKRWMDPNGQVYSIDQPGNSYPWSTPGRKYLEQELLENSIVPIPSNIEAIAVSVRSLIQRAGGPLHAAPPAPAEAVEPMERLKALADELAIPLEVVEFDADWLKLGVKKPLAQTLVKVGAVLSQANKTQLLKVWDLIATIESACEDAETALTAVLGAATPADESEAA